MVFTVSPVDTRIVSFERIDTWARDPAFLAESQSAYCSVHLIDKSTLVRVIVAQRIGWKRTKEAFPELVAKVSNGCRQRKSKEYSRTLALILFHK